jgi:hypothetical protein
VPDDPERRLTLRQADQAHTDFAIIESDLEILDAADRPAARRALAYLPYRDTRRLRAFDGFRFGLRPALISAGDDKIRPHGS